MAVRGQSNGQKETSAVDGEDYDNGTEEDEDHQDQDQKLKVIVTIVAKQPDCRKPNKVCTKIISISFNCCKKKTATISGRRRRCLGEIKLGFVLS